MIRYRVELDDPRTHHFRVTLTVPQPAGEVLLALPVWIAGSYMVREFGRHLSGLQARQGARALPLEQLDKTTWRVRCAGRAALVITCRVYANDSSVRGAFLDARRGFINPTALCLRVLGREAEPHRLSLGRLPAGWLVATAMAPVPATAKANATAGGHAGPVHADDGRHFEAADYDELLDHPLEMGRFWRGRFQAGGVPHDLVVSGALPGFDGARLLRDTQRICAQQINFWHGTGPPPFKRYVFLLNALEDGGGGLEHRASTALLAARRDLPRAGMDPRAEAASDGYVGLLGLISHEYFHTWNVKRLKPADLAVPDHGRENHTELLWFFEGFTSYYDDLMLLRCGLIDAPRYLRLLAKAVNAVAATPGRLVQSVAEASFDAWVKYYRTDENTPNATVSYYLKGALVALAVDLTLRQAGGSLDDVMRALWQRSGAGARVSGGGGGASGGGVTGEGAIGGGAIGGGAIGGGAIAEADIAAVLAEVADRPLADELGDWVHGTDELPLAELLTTVGVQMRPERAGFAASLGLRLSEGPVSGVQVKSVLHGSAAAAAGLSAGDELLAVDGWRIRRLDEAQAWITRDRPFELLLVRDQRVINVTLRPDAASALAGPVSLQLHDKPGRSAAKRRRDWIDA